MLKLFFGSTSGTYSSFQLFLEIFCDILIALGIALILYLNVSAFKTDRKTFIKEYWSEFDVFSKVVMFILILPTWIYHFVKFLLGKRHVPIRKFKTKI